ncbi:Amiloride-sensitive sodium channel [Cooperia oncophora]
MYPVLAVAEAELRQLLRNPSEIMQEDFFSLNFCVAEISEYMWIQNSATASHLIMTSNNNYTSSRAGPMYGIRVLLFVNTSDYMSTSESAGVRLAIHAPTEYPFPDTFGYSAPVGFASSFGMKKKLIQRLSNPYGDCIHSETYNKTNYIYQNYDYHPEGCHRSCFQTNLIRDCSCGDPRFPVPKFSKHCSAFNATARPFYFRFIYGIGYVRAAV